MKTPRRRLAQTIADRSRSGSTKQLSQEVAAYLLDEGRVVELESLLRDVQADWAAAGYVEVLAHRAHALSEQNRTDIKQQIQAIYPQAKTITITEVHDPGVIGSVRLSLADRQLDLSVEAKLHKFKQLTAAGKD